MNPYILRLIYICLALLLALGSCAQTEVTENARAVKNCILDEIRGDTAAYVREFNASLDSLPLVSESDCNRLYMAVNHFTFEMHNRGSDARAIVLLRKILDILHNAESRTVTDTRQMLNTHVRLGATFTEMGMTALGMDYYSAGLKYCTDTAYTRYKAMLYNNLGIIYAQRDLYDKAEVYFDSAMKMNLSRKAYNETFLNVANLTELYACRGETEKALEASQESLDYVDGKKHPEQLARMRIQQGALYAALGQHDVAMIRYRSGLAQYLKLNDSKGLADAYLHICKMFVDSSQPDSAMFYAGKAFDICRSHERDDDMVATLRTMADIHKIKGEYRQAFDLMTEMTALRDSLLKAESRLRLDNRIDGDNALANPHPAPRSGRGSPWLPVALVALTGIIALLLIFFFRFRREYDEKIAVARQETSACRQELELLGREMTSLSLQRLKLSEGLENAAGCIRTVLTELTPRESKKRQTLRELLARVSNMAAFDADEEFRLQFERIHPDFYRTLSEKFPDLTARDLRLCAFLHLGMTTKEIAILTYREVRSVDSARNRLRKKLGIDINDDISDFLRRTVSCA